MTEAGDVEPEVPQGRSQRPKRSRTRWAALGVAAVVVVLVGFLAVSKKQTESADSPLLGKVAPSLVGKSLSGGRFDLTDERGRYVVVNFFASWCQPCREEAPELREWAQKHEASGDAILVNVLFQDTPAAARSFFAEYGGATWPVLAVDTDTIGLDWGVAKVPETFVVNPAGVVVTKTISTVTAAQLDGFLRRDGDRGSTTTVPGEPGVPGTVGSPP